jgi:uncharacterized protein
MAEIHTVADVDLDEPVLVEGLPGVGLVGKIAADHIVDQFGMTHYADVDCEGLPRVAVYEADERGVVSPVRIYADETRDLLVLQSDVPVSRTVADNFAECVTEWLGETGGFPLYLSGIAAENQDVGEVPDLFGVAAGDGGAVFDEHDIGSPPEDGVVGGPTGALLNRADRAGLDAAGLIVESDPRFPDPAAARKAIVDGVVPIASVDVDTDDLVESAEEIREQREALARRMREAGEEESSQAQPLRMYQ